MAEDVRQKDVPANLYFSAHHISALFPEQERDMQHQWSELSFYRAIRLPFSSLATRFKTEPGTETNHRGRTSISYPQARGRS